ncbi:hypothetical protein WJX73_000641 [Symbiochloris irregularis]|uniref:Uncharacterized protein n=1 Tax=Symbiochloris irregularis TaxID=706552 RepID=A0AAW1NPK7_9CHLO
MQSEARQQASKHNISGKDRTRKPRWRNRKWSGPQCRLDPLPQQPKDLNYSPDESTSANGLDWESDSPAQHDHTAPTAPADIPVAGTSAAADDEQADDEESTCSDNSYISNLAQEIIPPPPGLPRPESSIEEETGFFETGIPPLADICKGGKDWDDHAVDGDTASLQGNHSLTYQPPAVAASSSEYTSANLHMPTLRYHCITIAAAARIVERRRAARSGAAVEQAPSAPPPTPQPVSTPTRSTHCTRCRC